MSTIDLRALAERSGPERAYLSLYASGPEALPGLDNRIRRVRALLADDADEQTHFDHNVELLRRRLEADAPDGPYCAFVAWADDYVQSFALEAPVPDLLWVDSSPYIRPLAEMQDEYETFVVVAADATRARIYLITQGQAEEERRVRGDVKNSVKVGGWSQKRYARRRERELHDYAKDIAAALQELDARERFDRIVLVGSAETTQELRETLPTALRERVADERTADLDDREAFMGEAWDAFEEEERDEERALWDDIREAYMQGGRAAVGAQEVLEHAALGRVDHLLVSRDARIAGIRCRDCDNLSAGTPEACPFCGKTDVYTVDLVNELVELMASTGGTTEFADPIPGLTEAGDLAAMLRW